MSRSLKELLASPRPEPLLEAHNAVSAQIAEEAGFPGIWASSLTLSASQGLRDNAELTMTQALELLEAMADRVRIPILFDGDTGYGSFNHFQRLVRKLGQRRIAGVCIEDKRFPKSNSFVASEQQALAPVDEFCGKLRAGRDARDSDDFVIVARTEALIVGAGQDEALSRARRYAEAGADAIVVHSKAPTIDEVAAFVARWDRPVPLICIPTTYYSTPPEVFASLGLSVVIWANHLLRASVRAMQDVARDLYASATARSIEDRIVPLREVFRLQDLPGLLASEEAYAKVKQPSAIILAASRGEALGPLTDEIPKCLVKVGGEPLLHKLLRDLRAEGVRQLSIVRGYKKEALAPEGVRTFDNDAWASSGELSSLACAMDALHGDVLIAYGDLVLKRYILHELLSSTAPLTVVVDLSRRFRGPADKVTLAGKVPLPYEDRRATLQRVDVAIPDDRADGEWVGLLLCRGEGTLLLRRELAALVEGPGGRSAWMGDLLNRLAAQVPVEVVSIQGDWIDVDTLGDLGDLAASRAT